MTYDHIADVILRAGAWRAMRGMSPIAAAIVAAACVVATLVVRRGWGRRR